MMRKGEPVRRDPLQGTSESVLPYTLPSAGQFTVPHEEPILTPTEGFASPTTGEPYPKVGVEVLWPPPQQLVDTSHQHEGLGSFTSETLAALEGFLECTWWQSTSHKYALEQPQHAPPQEQNPSPHPEQEITSNIHYVLSNVTTWHI